MVFVLDKRKRPLMPCSEKRARLLLSHATHPVRFPHGHLMRCKRVRGFQTGDLVRARVPTGKNLGIHIGRVAVRASGSFNIQTSHGVVQGIHARQCSLLQRADGYGYAMQPRAASTPREERRFLSGLNAGVSAPEIG